MSKKSAIASCLMAGLFLIGCTGINVKTLSEQEEFFQFYQTLPHYKSYATTNRDLQSSNRWAAGYADEKTSAQEAVDIALDYCEKSHIKQDINKDTPCLITHLGAKEISYQNAQELQTLIDAYNSDQKSFDKS